MIIDLMNTMTNGSTPLPVSQRESFAEFPQTAFAEGTAAERALKTKSGRKLYSECE
ncbi:hypothetical protein [Paenibacillus sp. HB172176]|uniref:hypothetical protein n=1 Tax=Paenibacillus sp. HB172176 TaxID=2493690 RepID=UPI0014390365|nr:hypothetical protein [Paenibacillus sp. HB172176]